MLFNIFRLIVTIQTTPVIYTTKTWSPEGTCRDKHKATGALGEGHRGETQGKGEVLGEGPWLGRLVDHIHVINCDLEPRCSLKIQGQRGQGQ